MCESTESNHEGGLKSKTDPGVGGTSLEGRLGGGQLGIADYSLYPASGRSPGGTKACWRDEAAGRNNPSQSSSSRVLILAVRLDIATLTRFF